MTKRRKHTLESCKESALRYNTRNEWFAEDRPPYMAAYRRGWLEECCSHMESILISWTKKLCMESALQYNTRGAWQIGDQRAYMAARTKNWLEECCEHMDIVLISWTKDLCMESALQYNTRSEWRAGDNKAYLTAHRKGWVEECCEHMDGKPYKKWSKELCMESALQYNTRGEWQVRDKNAYMAAYKNDWAEECCAHMEEGLQGDYDTVYLWYTGESLYGKKLYKFGATSERLGDWRINAVAKLAGYIPEILFIQPVTVKAYELERVVKKMGTSPKFVGFNGATEFRCFTNEEVDQIMELVMAHAA